MSRFNGFIPDGGLWRSLPDAAGSGAAVGPRRIVQVVDVSPSMNGTDWRPSRLEAAKVGVLRFTAAAALCPQPVEIALVAYATRAATVLPLTSSDIEAKMRAAVGMLSTDWGTCIEAGLSEAERILRPHAGRPDLEVVLLTDGQSNLGDPKPPSERLKAMGCTISCIGIGGTPANVDEPLLRAIASLGADGKPRYRFIADPEGLERHYAQMGCGITR